MLRYNPKMGFLEWLALLLIALKLTDHTTLAWWWVLAPLWGQLIAGIIYALFTETRSWQRAKRPRNYGIRNDWER